MPIWIDLTGQRFGRLRVLSYNTHGPRYTWRCQCDCGSYCIVHRGDLRSGHTQSCGCLHIGSQLIDLTGQVFGRWTVLRFDKSVAGSQRGSTKALWVCQCMCGTVRSVDGAGLRSGKSKSCGCYSRELTRSRSSGCKSFPEYIVWQGMRSRCLNPNTASYHNYGGRGIVIDPRWDSFQTFYMDMGPRPSPSHTLERKNNDLGYDAENCIWAPRSIQTRNTRQNHWITFNGITLCISDWDRLLCFTRGTIYNRLSRHWSIIRALSTPISTKVLLR